jgi:HEAT repeat protein
MNHRLALCFLIVLPGVGCLLGPGQFAAAQEEEAPEAPSLDLLVEEFVHPYIRYDDYLRVSNDLASQGAGAVPPLLERLPSSNRPVQLRILGTLSRIGPDSEPALPELRRLLRDKDPSIRAASAKCLSALGAAGQPALPDLFQALRDSDQITVAWAARAIDAMEPDFVTTRLQDLLRRMGTTPENVRLLPLRTWYRIARRNVNDPAMARDLWQWTLVVHYTSRDGVRVADLLTE